MTQITTPAADGHLRLAIFRLNDMCVSVQEGMERFLATASVEPLPGVEASFRWLRKRGVRICLLSDYDREQTLILLRRLQWTVDEEGTVQEVITHWDEREDNPVRLAQENAGLALRPHLSFSAFDLPDLLRLASAARVHFNLAVCNGRASYAQLSACPHHSLLDNLRQLPEFIIQHLPEPEVGRIPRLRLPQLLRRR
jgi:phosphoglycolate phosphatase-like HAD superfamily hydrolase